MKKTLKVAQALPASPLSVILHYLHITPALLFTAHPKRNDFLYFFQLSDFNSLKNRESLPIRISDRLRDTQPENRIKTYRYGIRISFQK